MIDDVRTKAVTRSAYAVTLLAGLQAGWFGPLLPSIAQAQHVPLEKTGVFVSAICAGGFFALAVSKPIIARLGDLRTTLLATSLAGLGFIGMGFLGGIDLLTLCAFCYGVGVGLNSIASHTLFPRYYPTKVASALSKLNVFFGLGALIGPLIVLILFSLKAPYNWVFIWAGLYTIGLSAFLLQADRRPKTAAVGGQSPVPDIDIHSSAEGIKAVLMHPVLLALTTINFLYVGVETTLGTWIYTFLQRAEGLNGIVASAAVSLLYLGLTLGRIFSARACLKVDPKYVTLSAMLILVGTIFAAATVHVGAALALPLVLLIGIGMGPIFPTVIAQNAAKFGAASSTTTTIVIAAGCFGGMLLPWLAGYGMAAYGALNFMLATGAIAALLPILFGLALFSPPPRDKFTKSSGEASGEPSPVQPT